MMKRPADYTDIPKWARIDAQIGSRPCEKWVGAWDFVLRDAILEKRRILRFERYIRRTLRFSRGHLVRVSDCPLAPRRCAEEPRAPAHYGIETVHLLEGRRDAFCRGGTRRRRHRYVVSPFSHSRRLGRGGLPPRG